MPSKCAYVFSEKYLNYNFSATHPMQPVRLKLTFELTKECGLLTTNKATIIEPRVATDEELLLVHTADYIKSVKKVSELGRETFSSLRYGLGLSDNPVFKDMHTVSAIIVGGSIQVAELIAKGQAIHALNIGGGLHHALTDKASGFCIYNDAAIAIAYLKKNYNWRVCYIDIDAHHGDGVQWFFYEDPQVLTISLHEDGRFLFPGTGFVNEIGQSEGEGFSINLPLPPYTFDEIYLEAFETVVTSAVRLFKPDILVTQCGCDGHFSDPLTHLSLSLNLYKEIFIRLHHLAHEICQGRWLALGGGGYQIYSVVPQTWTVLFATQLNARLPDKIPKNWLSLCEAKAGKPCLDSFLDNQVPVPDLKNKQKIKSNVYNSIRQIEKLVFPKLSSLF
jgi:acetoin utilization protein AcuC